MIRKIFKPAHDDVVIVRKDSKIWHVFRLKGVAVVMEFDRINPLFHDAFILVKDNKQKAFKSNDLKASILFVIPLRLNDLFVIISKSN